MQPPLHAIIIMDTDEAKIFHALLICGVILAVFIFLFVRSILWHHHKNVKLQKEKTEVEINTLEQERKRIAANMHDEVALILSTVVLRLEAMKLTTIQQGKDVAKMKELLHEVIQKIREISYDLMPPLLQRNGLFAAMRNLAETIEDTGVLKVVMQLPTPEPCIPSQKEIHFYRIFQEAIHNTMQHARATTFNIDIHKNGAKIYVKMKDDGIGFKYDGKPTETWGLGMSNILNRVELLNGEMYIETKPGAGVEYNIIIPCDR